MGDQRWGGQHVHGTGGGGSPLPPATQRRPMVLDGATWCNVHSIVHLGHPMKTFGAIRSLDIRHTKNWSIGEKCKNTQRFTSRSPIYDTMNVHRIALEEG